MPDSSAAVETVRRVAPFAPLRHRNFRLLWTGLIVSNTGSWMQFVALGYLGLKPAEGAYVLLARIFTILYFAFFVLMPLYTRGESTSRVPERVTTHD